MANKDYVAVAASQTNKALGSTNAGAVGDWLERLVIVPASVSPGVVTLKDGGGSSVTLLPGGTNSLTELKPITVEIGAFSTAGAWSVTTGANVSVIAFGKFA